jgi:tripartite-type tricarboxylate transporter receptor subunit TctC
MEKGAFWMKHISSAMLAGVMILCMSAFPVQAADYPTKPITLINPYSAGGSHDLLGRAFASVAEKYLGQPVVVVNKPGASGHLGGLAGAQAAPDGYTLTLHSGSMTGALEWDIAEGRTPHYTRHDFISIIALNMSPTLVIVPYDSPWKSLADLIRDCKAKPEFYAFSSGGLYTMSHIPAELLTRAVGIKCRHVPYNGGGPAVTAIVGGHADFSTQFPSSTIALAKGKKLRYLAVQSDRRVRALPDVPSVKELGIDAEYYGWVGVSAPVKTPKPIVDKLREVAKKVVEDKAYVDLIEKLGDEVRYMTGDELTKYWDAESEKVAILFKELIKKK